MPHLDRRHCQDRQCPRTGLAEPQPRARNHSRSQQQHRAHPPGSSRSREQGRHERKQRTLCVVSPAGMGQFPVEAGRSDHEGREGRARPRSPARHATALPAAAMQRCRTASIAFQTHTCAPSVANRGAAPTASAVQPPQKFRYCSLGAASQ